MEREQFVLEFDVLGAEGKGKANETQLPTIIMAPGFTDEKGLLKQDNSNQLIWYCCGLFYASVVNMTSCEKH